MIGLVLHQQGIRFASTQGSEFAIYDHELDGEKPWDPAWVSAAFECGKASLGFSERDDFRLMVDTPWSHAVAQNVPFGEKQLEQVLENYLEEEFPDDIEDYAFDYRLLDRQSSSCSVLGFWIHADILRAWTSLADELSLNALDIQPAEEALLARAKDHRLDICTDLQGRLRYSLFLKGESLPQLTLGLLPATTSPQRLLTHLKLQGGNWAQVSGVDLELGLEDHKESLEKLGLSNIETTRPALPGDPFSPHALDFSTAAPLQFRKGEFAQKGIAERLVWPATVLGFALCILFLALSWSNVKATQDAHTEKRIHEAQMAAIWKKLFSDRPPKSRMVQNMEGRYKAMTGTDTKPGDEKEISSLQVLGKLFSYLGKDDLITIEKIVITKSIQISGFASDQERIYRMNEAFQNQTDFKKPNITSQDRSNDEGPRFTFRFSTSYLGETKK